MMQNKEKLEYTGNLHVVEMPVYGASPSNNRKHLQTLPRKAIWVGHPTGQEEFLEVRTQRFTTIQNYDIFKAIADVAYDKGLNLQVQKSVYYNGKTTTNFLLPDAAFESPGDGDKLTPGIFHKNDFGGGGANVFDPSCLKDWCSNGMVFGYHSLADPVVQRHVGEINEAVIYGLVETAFDRLDTAVHVIRATAHISAATVVSDEDIVVFLKGLEEKTAKKYQEKLAEVVQDNISNLGQNAWGVIQGVSEMYQHHMNAPEHGGTKLAWRDRTIDDFLATVGVKEKVKVAVNLGR